MTKHKTEDYKISAVKFLEKQVFKLIWLMNLEPVVDVPNVK